jgi:hypothetical protein
MLSSSAARQVVLETLNVEARLRQVIRFLSADIRRHKKQEPL